MSKHILIIEDDPDMTELLACTIEMAGFRVDTARDGLEGLRKARKAAPDLILLDLMLPGLDGFTVCERLRENSRTAGAPILVMSGMPGEIGRYSSMESGASEHIQKPFTTAFIISRIRFHLRLSEEAVLAGNPG